MYERGQTSKPSLFLALAKAFGLSFAVAGFLKFISDLLNFVGPQVLKLVMFIVFVTEFVKGVLYSHPIFQLEDYVTQLVFDLQF